MPEMRQFINVLNEATVWNGEFNTKYGPLVERAMKNAKSHSMGSFDYWYIDRSPINIDNANDSKQILDVLADVITCCNLKHLGNIIKGTADWAERCDYIMLLPSHDRHAEQDVLEAVLGLLEKSLKNNDEIQEGFGSRLYKPGTNEYRDNDTTLLKDLNKFLKSGAESWNGWTIETATKKKKRIEQLIKNNDDSLKREKKFKSKW